MVGVEIFVKTGGKSSEKNKYYKNTVLSKIQIPENSKNSNFTH